MECERADAQHRGRAGQRGCGGAGRQYRGGASPHLCGTRGARGPTGAAPRRVRHFSAARGLPSGRSNCSGCRPFAGSFSACRDGSSRDRAGIRLLKPAPCGSRASGPRNRCRAPRAEAASTSANGRRRASSHGSCSARRPSSAASASASNSDPGTSVTYGRIRRSPASAGAASSNRCNVVAVRTTKSTSVPQPGFPASRLPGFPASRLPGFPASRLPGFPVKSSILASPSDPVRRFPGRAAFRGVRSTAWP